jgi:hypothetical protein
VSVTTAVLVVLAVAVVLLWLGLVRLAYEVRQLRRLTLEQARDAEEEAEVRLPSDEPRLLGRTVLAVSSSCDTCWTALAEARARADAAELVVLTYQDPEVFAEAAGALPVVRSRDAWRAVSHLSPPVLLRVEQDGRVTDVALPVTEGDVTDVLARWHGQEVRT